jgi:hypothetical protein
MTAADYCITVAIAAETVYMAFYLLAIRHGFGRHNHYISPDDMVMINRYLLGIYLAGVVGSGFARISIAVLLLRFTMTRAGRIAVWVIIAIQIAYIVVFEIIQMVGVHFVHHGLDQHAVHDQSHGYDVDICVDGYFLVWRLSRSVVEKDARHRTHGLVPARHGLRCTQDLLCGHL